MELWTAEHAKTLLPAVAVMAGIALLLRKTIGKKDLKIRMIPFQIISCLLFALEIGKQVMSAIEGYDLYHIPFHFCSLFIFMMPIMAFYNGKHKAAVTAITSAICTATTLLTLIYPCLIYSASDITNFFSDYFSFHTVMFHNIVIFAFILILALELHTPAAKGETKPIILFMICFCAVSATMAQLLQTNYNNFYSCNIPPLEQLRVNMQGILGYGVTQALYIAIVTVLDILFVLGSYWFYRLLRSIVTKKERVA